MQYLQDNLPAVIVAILLLLVLGGVLWYAARVAEPAVPSAPSGPPTGAASMERKVGAIIAMLVGTMLVLFGYGLREPARQAAAQSDLLNTDIGYGIENYSSLCFTCHGEKGQGAVVPGSSPEQLAPPLNQSALQPTDPDGQAKEFDTLFKTISRGIPSSPMPAWDQTDGGPLMDEDINDLVQMILNGADPNVNYNGQTGTPWQIIDAIVTANVAAGTATMPAQPEVTSLPFYQQLTPEEQQGVQVILQFGCGGCHTIPEIPGAQGTIGPNEDGVANRRTIAGGAVPNNDVQDLANWIHDPSSLKPGTAMPTLGLTPDQALAAASFLYTMKGGGVSTPDNGAAPAASPSESPSASPAASPEASPAPGGVSGTPDFAPAPAP